jgi:GTP cyclohydrolase I
MLTMALPFATRVVAPASGAEAWQVHDLSLRGALGEYELEVETTVTAEVTSLCPCSKAVSDYGAHNQRSQVALTVLGDADDPYPVPVHEIAEMIRRVGSAPVYPLVKRPDERVITMQAYDHPAFVEDMVRDVSLACRARGLPHRVNVRNIESIHSHDAIAVVQCMEVAG